MPCTLAMVQVVAMGEVEATGKVEATITEKADGGENTDGAVESTNEVGGGSAAAVGGDGSSAETTEGSAPVRGCYRCGKEGHISCLLYTSPSPRDLSTSRMPSSA